MSRFLTLLCGLLLATLLYFAYHNLSFCFRNLHCLVKYYINNQSFFKQLPPLKTVGSMASADWTHDTFFEKRQLMIYRSRYSGFRFPNVDMMCWD